MSRTPEARARGYAAGPLLLQREGRPLRGLLRRRPDQDRDALPARHLRHLRRLRRQALQPRDAAGPLQGQVDRRHPRADRRAGARALRERARRSRTSAGRSSKSGSGTSSSGSPRRLSRAARRSGSSSPRARAPLDGPDPLPAGRADDRAPLRRHPEAPRRPALPDGEGKHGDRHRAQPRRDPHRGLAHRPRARGRRRRRTDRGRGNPRDGRRRPGLAHRPVLRRALAGARQRARA